MLLYKKHPTQVCRDFLHIRHGFLIDPWFDYSVATGTWQEGGKFELSSPRGITFMENKSPLHAIVIALLGIGYVIAVKTSRLVASIKFGKLLV